MRGRIRWALESGAWRPSVVQLLARQGQRSEDRRRGTVPTNAHLRGVAEWLARAQDATDDGGVSWGYSLRRGWMASYPETSGYIVPTLLALAVRLDDSEWVDRAERAVRFLSGIQLASGAFPGARIDENATEPSVFNTAQIINGLLAWHRHSGESEAIERALRAGDWLVSVQDSDGAWRSHTYNGLATTYTAHASCWLAELGTATANARHVEAATRHMDWVLTQRDEESGWIDLAGFTADDHAARRSVAHTVSYVLAGVLGTALVTGRNDAVAAVASSARSLAASLDRHGWLGGMLDARWEPAVSWACPTGTAQAALVWFRLAEVTGAADLLPPARRAVELVTATQRISADAPPGVRGGIPASDPVWGDYLAFTYPNWPAKFYADALLADERLPTGLSEAPA